MATALMRGLQCPLRIFSCNTLFAKVKFSLKTTQLETIFNSCLEGKLFRGDFMGVIFQQLSNGQKPRGNFMGGNCQGLVIKGRIIRR